MIINHNLPALNTIRLLKATDRKQSKIGEKLSSGYRINKAGDNAAGLSISEKMRTQIRGLNQASRNAQDGVSLIETADGALGEIDNIVQRIRELSVQAANGTSTEDDKNMIQIEINELTNEIDHISKDTHFNNINLLDGSLERTEESDADDDYISIENLMNDQSNQVNILYTDHDYRTVQSLDGGNTDTNPKYDKLKELLKTEIVPQAVSKIISTFSPALNYLSSSVVGIGLKLEETNSKALASVHARQNWGGGVYYTDYTLTVNTKKLLDSSGNITDAKRKELEAIVAHEFVHGIMDEALTCGMAGVSNDDVDASNKFPLWFIEGMAQTAAGGYANFNDFVNNSLGIKSDSSVQSISSAVKGVYKLSNSNSDSTGNSPYGVGYLACMYLGYLANGATDISEQSIRTGLSNILKDMIGGKDLDTVIKEKTNNKYAGRSDFENKFGDADSSNFIKNLTVRVGEGNGSLLAESYTSNDVLPDGSMPVVLFQLDTTRETVNNVYPIDEMKMFSGGGAHVSGSEPVTGYKEGTSGAQGSQGGGSISTPTGNPASNKVNLSNIIGIDGIDFDSSTNTLTVTKNGDYTLSGVNSTGTKVVVNDGVEANITLDSVKINSSTGCGIKLEGNANVTLKLTGDNKISSTQSGKAAIGVTGDAVLKIEGDGKLSATGGELAAAIGGGDNESAGNIEIKGGEITAIGGRNAAGIGGGSNGAGGNIKVDGRSAVIKSVAGGGGAASIGAGSGVSGGNVNINKGVVSDGRNWECTGDVVIKSKIEMSGIFTIKNGSTVTLGNGGNITITDHTATEQAIKVEERANIKIEKGGVIEGNGKMDVYGQVDNRGTIKCLTDPKESAEVKNYITKIVNNIKNTINISLGKSLKDSLSTPSIQVVCNGNSRPLQSSQAVVYDENHNVITDLEGTIVSEEHRSFTYEVTFSLPRYNTEYFDRNGTVYNNIQNNYREVNTENKLNRLIGSRISDDGKSITYTYALELGGASAGASIDPGKLTLQVGANHNQIMGIDIDGMTINHLGLDSIFVITAQGASNAISSCDEAIKKVSNTRSRLGAYQNRLEHTIANLNNSEENLQNSESRIRDLDMAKGMAEYSKYHILEQVQQAMLSQANQISNNVLNLLKV